MARVVRDKDIRLAVKNVALWGDTDVLPFPLENHWFHDDGPAVVSLLQQLDEHFDDWLGSYPVRYERVLSGVGHVGFRATTQIDAVWNAYLLALLIRIGADIERSRVPVDKVRVFSYRFAPEETQATLFDRSVGWHAFQERAVDLSKQHNFVLSTDISNFYPRVYHHRIEHELARATQHSAAVSRIKILLHKLAVAGATAAQYEPQIVGTRHHEELWVPAEELEAFNDAIVGQIEVVAEYPPSSQPAMEPGEAG